MLLHDDSDFGTFGRFVETPVGEMDSVTRHAYDFTLKLRGLVPGPHKIWLANPRLLETIAPTESYFQKESTLTKGEIEIATCVITGHWRVSYANYEHERIAEQLGELPPKKVESILAGLPVTFDDPRQQIVYDLASTVAQSRVLPTGMFRRAQELLGDRGIVDVTVLMGWFSAVSLTLLAYDVPSNAAGLDQ
jgi:4-carboxymuconolactone decarboxylase